VTRLLRGYLGRYRLAILVVVAMVTVQALANLYLPSLNADIINNGVVTGDIDYILRTGAVMLVVTLVSVVCMIIGVYFASRVAMGVGRDLRGAIFRKVLAFSQTETNVFGTASLITRNTNDVQQVQMLLVISLTIMILAPITAVGGLVMALREDVPLSATLLIILPVMFGFVAIMIRRAMPLFRSMQVKVDRINQVMRETLSGIRVIRAFVRTRHEEERFDVANRDLYETALSVTRLFALAMPVIMAIFNLSSVVIMWFGAMQVDSGGMQIGNLTAFLQYVMQILMSVMMAMLMFVMVPRAAASAERIAAVLDTDISVHDPSSPTVDERPLGVVEFHAVDFGYPGAEDPVLHGISFVARPGETTAIVGSTGSGKSTLVNLLPRFYDVTGGKVTIDGVDVREMRQEDLWGLLGIVPQKAFLFSGTVATNVRYGTLEAPDEVVWDALRTAQAAEFVGEMEGGLDAHIAQGGTNVSGGQRQRLAIARAIARRPRIYVFDDSFSALDFATDARLRAALREETRDATVIIVAQRVGTIMHADRIVVLDAGRVVGSGTHRDLLETCETYREIVFSQLTAEEVA
jgi:ATP-binding cassette, subfamily B, multidrug efflux pump